MNMSYSEIAAHAGRIKSVVMREAKRLGRPEDYDPDKAQKDFEEKNKLIGTKKRPREENNKKTRNKNGMDRRKRKATPSRTESASLLHE